MEDQSIEKIADITGYPTGTVKSHLSRAKEKMATYLKQNGYDGNNDKLLIDFFAENRQEIPDNGFTRRVMRHLPDRTRRISQVWVTFCFTLALVLFFVFDGLQQVLGTLRETLTAAAQSGVTELDPKSLLVAGIVLLFLLYRKICSLA